MQCACLGHERVLTTGTYLDSLRFRFHLARRLGVSPATVDVLILGEHGARPRYLCGPRPGLQACRQSICSRGPPVTVNEVRREIEPEVRYANITIIEGIGASQHGIGMVSPRIAEMVLRDERAVIPIGSYNPRYGVTLSLPSILGRNGVARILEPELSEDERQALQRSADTLKAASARMA